MDPDSENEHDITTVSVRIYGIVQGVFYRSSLKDEADRLFVKGWTRNLPDGSVEALLQGPNSKVQKVLDWCKTGPRNAQVDSVKISTVDTETVHHDFEILY